MRVLAAVLLAALLAGVARAQPTVPHLYLSPFAGWHQMDEDFRDLGGTVEDAAYFGGRLGYRLWPSLAIEIAAGTTPTEREVAPGVDPDVDFAHVSGDLLIHPLGDRAFSPFVLLGLGAAHTKPAAGNDKIDQLRASWGLGANLWLNDVIGVRLEGRVLTWVPQDDFGKADVHDVLAGAGLTFAIGGRGKDGDGDGVPDRRDRCPGTPRGVIVDDHGCPIDSDRDGVPDGIDQCAASPAGARVDERGCPLDSDGDGVVDGVDACEGTPHGATVDARGCPLDSDGDAVPDGLDRCPGTPRGVAVNDSGCVRDSDGDGVGDDRDRCADTPLGALVDSAGCPASEAALERDLEQTGRVRLENVRFESGLAVLMLESSETLDEVGRVLVRHPQLAVEIGGHTDSRGTAAANRTLALRRAEAVRDYLFEHFPELDRGRFTVRGYGEDRPVASNATDAGRARNRRVEFVVKPSIDRRPERLPASPDQR